MNLVAHQLLSFDNKDLQIGNLLGDIIKGNKYLTFPDKIKIGILLHREIDSFTDSHEIVKKSASYFHASQHKFSPIIIDVIYDYFLIKHWHLFSKVPFNTFKNNCYQLFQDRYENLPEKLQIKISYLIKYDWFENYKSIEGVQKTLKGVGKQSKFENNLDHIIPEFEKNYTSLENDFLLFYPKLINHCKAFLHSYSNTKISF
ncbi:ACP phosphodiesterase [Chishuiella sp.]|uniref:acyl carrier protein phosphodiesterase n=1 Tax=Chishuiella sp. TaxID=1969467 RepID=UPI0028B1EA00|nr:ACP phosphodiesterase [Chishuiella sp.]